MKKPKHKVRKCSFREGLGWESRSATKGKGWGGAEATPARSPAPMLPAEMKRELGWPRTPELPSPAARRPGERQRDLSRSAARAAGRVPPQAPEQWPGLRASRLSGALPFHLTALQPLQPVYLLPVPGSPVAPSRLSSPSVYLSWRENSGHRLGWTRAGCPGVQGSCFRSWSCSLSTQVSDIGWRARRRSPSSHACWEGRSGTFVGGKDSAGRWNPPLDLHAVLFCYCPLTFPFDPPFPISLSICEKQLGNPSPTVWDFYCLNSVSYAIVSRTQSLRGGRKTFFENTRS